MSRYAAAGLKKRWRSAWRWPASAPGAAAAGPGPGRPIHAIGQAVLVNTKTVQEMGDQAFGDLDFQRHQAAQRGRLEDHHPLDIP